MVKPEWHEDFFDLMMDSGHLTGYKISNAESVFKALDELSVRFEDVEITNRIKLYGLEKLRELLPKVEKTYHVYKDKLGKLNFIMDDKGIHGKTHTLRVLLLSLLLANTKGS